MVNEDDNDYHPEENTKELFSLFRGLEISKSLIEFISMITCKLSPWPTELLRAKLK
jgi:hypothetical protein